MQEGILIHHAIDMGLSGLEYIIVIMCLLLCGYRTVGIEIAICYSYYHKVSIIYQIHELPENWLLVQVIAVSLQHFLNA